MSASWREKERRGLRDSVVSSDSGIFDGFHRSYDSSEHLDDEEGHETTFDDSDRRQSPLLKRRFTWGQRRQVASHNGSVREKDDTEVTVKGPVGLRLLHPSREPLIDLIFVHGLKGDSIKTWTKNGDLNTYWPQVWLPMEDGFENANIHSFGYDSDWASSKSSFLNVHDFGQGLLEEMRNAPQLRNNNQRPIILIGHSMGGLIIKKAFILAQDVPDFKPRIKSIFFLSTPHKGNDFASTLNNILALSGVLSSRHYLADITKGSVSLRLINEDFGRLAHDLPIVSFYETLKTNIGVSSILIVDKDSAVLGSSYRNERVLLMDADHRSICKYGAVSDTNYIRIRNALAGAVGTLLRDVSESKREESMEQLKALRSYLDVSDSPDERHNKVSGSCEWIDVRDDFQDWRDCSTNLTCSDLENTAKPENLAVFWVHANPGTGKTVLASHIVSHLESLQLECAYFYFHAGDKASRSLGAFLRSVSYQMALANSAVREKLFKLCQEGSTFDMDNSWTIWTKIFKKGVFQSQLCTPQYWVIDGLDECRKYQELFTMLKGERPSFPLRIFMTSRNVPDIQRLRKTLDPSSAFTCFEIPTQDSNDDIRRYIQSRIDNLPIDSVNDREDLAATILRKSEACFLWVRLVLDELENVYSSDSIMEVLEGIPEGMVPYYERTIKAMAENSREKHIAKAVLLWTVTSARKLTITELSQALKLDINTFLPSAKSAVEGLCGQLVTVDNETGMVDMIHPTAREFLLSSDGAGEFTISKPEANQRTASACLKLLTGMELRPPRNRRFLSQARPEPSPLLEYAMTQFSEHIYLASSENDGVLGMINTFLKTNVLSWIERLALKDNLYCLIRTSKNLKAFLDRRAKYQSPLNSQVKLSESWSMDLSRLVTQFGGALTQDPSSIYFLIPPLCPSGSAIYQQFGKTPDGLLISGYKSAAWDDCLAYVDFGSDIAAAISCGESLIAVGMESGEVNLYNHRSCQKESVIRHKSSVDLVHLFDGFIISCTTKNIVLQDVRGNTLWEKRLRFRCLLLTSSDDCVVVVSQHGHLIKWNKETGEQVEDQVFPYRNYDADTEHNGLATRAPQVASISPDLEMLALGYRGGAVCLWDIREHELVGWAIDEKGRRAEKLLFNPNPNINLLLVIYTNHGLALYDSWSGNLVHAYDNPENIGLLSASCSPDGRTLVTTDSYGNMHIWDFDSLTILYHLFSPFPSFRILNFTSDGSSIVDVMDSSMRIWSPTVLVRKNTEEDASTSDIAVQLAVKEGEYESRKNATITVLCVHPTLSITFAGRHNGQIVAFATKGNNPPSVLYSHPQMAIVTKLAVFQDILASSDFTGRLQIWRFDLKTIKPQKLCAEINFSAQVKQLCFSADGDYLLVSTVKGDSVYRVKDGFCIGSLEVNPDKRRCWRWLVLPQLGIQGQHFSLLLDGMIETYDAASFPNLIENSKIKLRYKNDSLPFDCQEADIDTALVEITTKMLVLEVRYVVGMISSTAVFIFDMKHVKLPMTTTLSLEPLWSSPPKKWKHFLGFSQGNKSFTFLHQDSWVSSIDINNLQKRTYTRHFFVPKDYLSSNDGMIPVKTVDDDMVFCQHGELTSVRNGMKFSSIRTLE